MKRYISDCHFYDTEAISMYDRQNFKTVEDMNAYMISQWNATVKGGDIVVVLGDMFGTKDVSKVNYVLNRLNGKIYLIEGNHDPSWIKSEGVNLNRFDWIKPYAEIKDRDNIVIASHYPIFCYNSQHLQDEHDNYRTYMLYGHVHNSAEADMIDDLQEKVRSYDTVTKKGKPDKMPSQMINCYCVRSDYKPLSLDEWILFEKDRLSKK